MNERGCVDGMQEYRPQRTRFTRLQFLVACPHEVIRLEC